MAVLATGVDCHAESFQRNREGMLAAVQALRDIEASVHATEQSKAERYRKREQLLPRDRVNLLLDRGSPFLELSTLCGYGCHDDTDGSLAGGNSICGIGYVSGVRCMVNASNSAIKGGTMTPWGVQKTLRIQEIARQQKLPIVSLIESGGANLLYQDEMFIEGGRTFANQARLSAQGLPQITVVHGSSTAGGAYMPGLSDYVIMVRGRAKVFLAGPPLLKAATGEIAEDEELGGADMHAGTAGTCEYLAADDADGIRQAREVMARLDWNARAPKADLRAFGPPRYDIDELCGIVSADHKKPYDCREVIARLVDDSDFDEFKADFDAQLVCGHAAVEGRTVGVIGNNGPITTQGANKAAQFIQLCCQADIPLVFLQNITGYMVGKDAEQAGMVKHGSKMIQAVANAHVPKITFVIGGSFGAGNYGMCGRGFSPDFIFAWPNARTAVMGGEQAAGVMQIVTEAKYKGRGEAPPEGMLDKMYEQITTKFEQQGHAFYGSARLFDDGLIDPRDTRRVLALTLSVCRDARQRDVRPNDFGVARF
ncbi:Geranyl-CoA carboxylase beta-subunit protein [Salinisphaera shabanensis E1L3A]|uniref:Geranyl-CoA carboxylase beta-subunit protein n=1 Tax=Salinisphaera shabanensis E1L3A TaxID=1033802 RepID=U2ER23_9GAMM|nr:carboxyl transferase domain-containing protein [Salinisphaera shabanensis]ERJ20205.1 Geranyl-CoA carboxylase beta-subunit protein [Salinisphaera shabanensis E1L3A]